MKNTYQRKKTANNQYEVLGADGNTLKNHNDKPYPLLSDIISKNLIDDLNAINDKNIAEIFKNNNEEEAVMEMTLHNISNLELNESFGYCVISTLMEYEQANKTKEFKFEQQMQWDRLFRFNPGPPSIQLEYKNTQNIREFLGDKWVNLPLNYSSSLEEMEENESGFVPEATINEISKLIGQMSMAEKVMVDILYHFYDFFSITIPILWVAGKISNEDIIAAYYTFIFGIDIYEISDLEYEEPSFAMDRLQCLKEMLEGYKNKDQTLPCVNC